jgi:hypothetical protein
MLSLTCTVHYPARQRSIVAGLVEDVKARGFT